MKSEVKGNKLILTLDMDKEPKLSKSGKTRMVATTHGFMDSGVTVKDQPLKVSVNAVIKA